MDDTTNVPRFFYVTFEESVFTSCSVNSCLCRFRMLTKHNMICCLLLYFWKVHTGGIHSSICKRTSNNRKDTCNMLFSLAHISRLASCAQMFWGKICAPFTIPHYNSYHPRKEAMIKISLIWFSGPLACIEQICSWWIRMENLTFFFWQIPPRWIIYVWLFCARYFLISIFALWITMWSVRKMC